MNEVLKSEFLTKIGHNRSHGLQAAIMLAESSEGSLEIVDLPGKRGAYLRINVPYKGNNLIVTEDLSK